MLDHCLSEIVRCKSLIIKAKVFTGCYTKLVILNSLLTKTYQLIWAWLVCKYCVHNLQNSCIVSGYITSIIQGNFNISWCAYVRCTVWQNRALLLNYYYSSFTRSMWWKLWCYWAGLVLFCVYFVLIYVHIVW